MSDKEKFNTDEMEIIDIDLRDIEDRINEELKNEELEISETVTPISDKSIRESIEEELPVIEDVPEQGVELKPINEVPDEEEMMMRTEKKRRKRKASDYVRYCIMAIAVCVLVYAGYQLAMIFMEYKEAVDEYNQIEDLVSDEGTVVYQERLNSGDPFDPTFTPQQVDWQSLASINGDVYAWIQFESADLRDAINYPVMKGTDNDYYLSHTINGTENTSGSIFIECGNDAYFNDMNTIVYGHNMKNNSMFGLLRNYKKAEYYAGHEYFWIYTPEGRFRYKIFSCYEPLSDSDTYRWWSAPCDDYTQYLTQCKAASKYDTGVNVEPNDQIVTLSTCTSRGDNYRFVVQGKLIYSEYK